MSQIKTEESQSNIHISDISEEEKETRQTEERILLTNGLQNWNGIKTILTWYTKSTYYVNISQDTFDFSTELRDDNSINAYWKNKNTLKIGKVKINPFSTAVTDAGLVNDLDKLIEGGNFELFKSQLNLPDGKEGNVGYDSGELQSDGSYDYTFQQLFSRSKMLGEEGNKEHLFHHLILKRNEARKKNDDYYKRKYDNKTGHEIIELLKKERRIDDKDDGFNKEDPNFDNGFDKNDSHGEKKPVWKRIHGWVLISDDEGDGKCPNSERFSQDASRSGSKEKEKMG